MDGFAEADAEFESRGATMSVVGIRAPDSMPVVVGYHDETQQVDGAAGRRADAADERRDRDPNPGRSPSLSRMPTAMAMKMAAAGTSETTIEMAPVPIMKT